MNFDGCSFQVSGMRKPGFLN